VKYGEIEEGEELSKHQKREKLHIPATIVFLGPAVGILLLFFFIPAVLTGLLSFTSMDEKFSWDFIGVKNFLSIFSDPLFRRIILNTVIYTFGVVIFFTVGLAILLALLTTNVSRRTGDIFRIIWLLPRLTPPAVYAMLWLWMFDPTDYGVVNSLLKGLFGSPPRDFIGSYPMVVIIFVSGFISASLGMLVLSAAIEAIPKDYIVAAKVDGASGLQIARRIILPLIKWPLSVVVVFETLTQLTNFQRILLITNGGPFYASEVLALYTFHQAIEDFEIGYGGALALILVVISLILALIYWRLFALGKHIQPAKIEIR